MTNQQRDAYRSAARAAGLVVPEHANVVPLADGGAIVECEVEISAAAMRQHLPDPPLGGEEPLMSMPLMYRLLSSDVQKR